MLNNAQTLHIAYVLSNQIKGIRMTLFRCLCGSLYWLGAFSFNLHLRYATLYLVDNLLVQCVTMPLFLLLIVRGVFVRRSTSTGFHFLTLLRWRRCKQIAHRPATWSSRQLSMNRRKSRTQKTASITTNKLRSVCWWMGVKDNHWMFQSLANCAGANRQRVRLVKLQ